MPSRYCRRSAPRAIQAVAPYPSYGSMITVSAAPALDECPISRVYPARLFGSGWRTRLSWSATASSVQAGSRSTAPTASGCAQRPPRPTRRFRPRRHPARWDTSVSCGLEGIAAAQLPGGASGLQAGPGDGGRSAQGRAVSRRRHARRSQDLVDAIEVALLGRLCAIMRRARALVPPMRRVEVPSRAGRRFTRGRRNRVDSAAT